MIYVFQFFNRIILCFLSLACIVAIGLMFANTQKAFAHPLYQKGVRKIKARFNGIQVRCVCAVAT